MGPKYRKSTAEIFRDDIAEDWGSHGRTVPR